MGPRQLLRIALRLGVWCLAGGAAYVLITFAQVWWASASDSHDRAQAIVVLGAAQYDGVPSPVLAGRLDHALELYESGAAPTIVVTGGRQEGDRFTEAAAGYKYLRQRGVPDGALLREEQGTNTWEQMAATTRFLRSRGIDDVILVSDDYHAFRIDRIARELGLSAQVSPTDSGLSVAGRGRAMVRETLAVAVGRVIGFRRLVDLDESITGK